MSSLTQNLPAGAVWFVTGCSSGIGFSFISTVLSNPGHRIVVLSRNPSSITLPATSNESNTLLRPIDLTSPASIEAAINATVTKFGRIDVVVNNAGYSLLGEFETITEEVSRELFEINYWAPVTITRHALHVMRDINPKSGPVGGIIAQISSSGGYTGVAGISPYNASKFALEGFTEAVSKELDPAWNIGFLIVEPGSVKTKWASANMISNFEQHEAYVGKTLGTDLMKGMQNNFEAHFGADPDTVADMIVAVIKGEKANWDGKELLRLPAGADAWALVHAEALDQAKRFEKIREVSESTSAPGIVAALKELGFGQ